MGKYLPLVLLFLLASCSRTQNLPAPPTPDIPAPVAQVESIPEAVPAPVVKMAAKLTGKVNGSDWEGESIMNPPPYYKYGSRMMMSPDRPIFKMSFGRMSDNSSVNFDLKGELKVGSYTKDSLDINYSDNSGTNVYEPENAKSNISVEVTNYTESGNSAIISGKISGTIFSSTKGTTTTLDLEWKDVQIDVWGMEAK